MNKLHKEWLKSASDDLLLITEIRTNKQLTHLQAFHSQQAVEKSLKALLEYNNINIPKSHSLTKLFALVKTYIQIDNYDIVDLLDQLYIDSRYPGDLGLLPNGKPTLEDAKIFYDFANKINIKIIQLTNGNIN